MSKAEYARKWRSRTRQSRRENTLMCDYLAVKYPAIHTEIKDFYEMLNAKYYTKDNLTKTLEYRIWKADQRRARTTEGTNSTTPPESEQTSNSTTPPE